MKPDDAAAVRKLPLFKDIDVDSFSTLTSAGYLQRFPQGVVLIHEGEFPHFLHILVQGAVEFLARHNELETTITVLNPPAAFVLAAVVTDDVYLQTARTLCPSTVVLIPAVAVRDVFARDQAFAFAAMQELARRYRSIVKDLKNQRLRAAAERLANWILIEEQRQGGRGELTLPFEKRVLANRLGMRAENLSRALADLARLGIQVKGPSIAVGDRAALVAFAQPNPLIDGPELVEAGPVWQPPGTPRK